MKKGGEVEQKAYPVGLRVCSMETSLRKRINLNSDKLQVALNPRYTRKDFVRQKDIGTHVSRNHD